jgi:hypothetical protein|tara:strand:+ start:4978 stop:5442 length:465 start_codon:yes stop_codon:yes gene_type:complete
MKSLTNGIVAATVFCATMSIAAAEDQVVVIEDLSRSELRKEIVLIEQELYQMFNDNNSAVEFEIKCEVLMRTGTHIPVQACEPKFMRDARAQNAADSQFGIQTLIQDSELRQYYAGDYEKLTLAMEGLAKKSGKFSQLVMILNKLNARLAQLER